MEVHLAGTDERSPEPEFVEGEEEDHDRDGHAALEPILGQGRRARDATPVRVSNRRKSGPELHGQDEDIEDEAEPGARDAGLGYIGQIAHLATL